MRAFRHGSALILFAIAGAGFVPAQTAKQPQRRPRPAEDAVSKESCPAAVPPAANNSSAAATDFVELQRTRCYGSCPAYTVRIGGDGRVTWHGEGSVDVMGDQVGIVDSNDARTLIQRIADRGFWGLCGSYSRAVTDNPTYFTTLSIAGHVKRVQDYALAAPSWLRALDDDIDRVADTHQWRHGPPATETFGTDRLATDIAMPKNGVTRLMQEAVLPDTKEMEDWLKTLPDVNARDSSGWTALMYAAQGGTLEAMQVLLRAGADPLAQSNEGETALSAAVSAVANPEVKATLLVQSGVDVNSRDKRGVSPLMLACRQYWRPRLLATLLDLGADPSKRDADGKKAADYLDAQFRITADKKPYDAAKALLTR